VAKTNAAARAHETLAGENLRNSELGMEGEDRS
jgi:hypothetical protein